mgnify:CR=1 FL=1
MPDIKSSIIWGMLILAHKPATIAESIKENKKIVEANLNNLKSTYNQLNMDKEKLNEELLRAKQEYDELMQIYELKKNEDEILRKMYNNHFNKTDSINNK